MASPRPTPRSGFSLMAMFGIGGGAQLERRVLNLPVAVERRRGPSCDNCGFGAMRVVPANQEHEGLLRCDRTGCGYLSDRPEGYRPDDYEADTIVRPS